MKETIHIEVFCERKNHEGERICGDVFLTKKIKEENRVIAVLSDGLGHGVKANILATLTSTMALSFTEEHKDEKKIAEIIMNTLPVCSERKISYSTFTILDIEKDGFTTIIEYDNPQAFVIRNNKLLNLEWQCLLLEARNNKGKEIKTCKFNPEKGDRIIFCSDGIVQSGLGSTKYPGGWGHENLEKFVLENVKNNPGISAEKLASKVVGRAYHNDGYHAKDDTSCGVVYFRQPRKLLLSTGPPFDKENDAKLASKVQNFEGKKIISGATTGDIIARELELDIEDSNKFTSQDLPPVSFMKGVDLITEGILTLTRVTDLLKNYDSSEMPGRGPADQVIDLLLNSDEIHFLVGTRINEAHQDPTLPVELEMRRNVIKRLANILEEKFLKETFIEFI